MGYNVKALNTFLTVLIGYLVNLGVPRLGEFIRCTALSRYEKVEVEKLVGTVIVERLFDAVCLLIVFGLTIGLQPELYENITVAFEKTTTSSPVVEKNNQSWIIILILLAGIGWLVWKNKKRSELGQQLIGIGRQAYFEWLIIRKKNKLPATFFRINPCHLDFISICRLYGVYGIRYNEKLWNH
jgi:hypothetical protein